MSTQTILVTRATGTQGIAVLHHLQKNGFQIHALVRDASDDRALAIKKNFGANLFEGALDDPGIIRRAAAGCTGLFLNLMPSLTPGFEFDNELLEARNVLAEAKAAGIKHVIYSTSLSVGKHEQLPGWDPKSTYARAILSKHAIEEEVRNGGFDTWTIIRPAYFMTNFLGFFGAWIFPELSKEHKFVASFKADTVLPLIDPHDIGAFTAAALSDPKKFGGQAIEIAGDTITATQVVDAISMAAGVPIKAKFRTEEETEALIKVNPAVSGQVALKSLINFVNMEDVKSWGVPLRSFEEFLTSEKALVDSTFGSK
ncbi:NAD dependent epimerase/dehydratase [Microthyrium microscopicum]|uniref:NAD dependent epimerase/dehydratase n=1 Tax=Microthyrium microscopicum TaxID=703497 RepID=A0A6A6UPE1_9PEZI|nr:NAD dependent epimerase/dehydratase [Microthyrium microscopicum]